MIKEVFNSITNGAGKAPVAGSNLESQTAESQGFFGKMFMALQQEDEQAQGHTLNTSGGKQENMMSDEPESKEGREAVKQALLNLMNGGQTISSESDSLKAGEATDEEVPQNLEGQNPIRLVVKTTEPAATNDKGKVVSTAENEVSTNSEVITEEKATTQTSSESKPGKLVGSEQGVHPKTMNPEMVNEKAPILNEVKDVSTDSGVMAEEKATTQTSSESKIGELVGSEQGVQSKAVNPEMVNEKTPILNDVKAETPVSNVSIEQPAQEVEANVKVEAKNTVNPEVAAENTISEKGNGTAPKTEHLKVGEAPTLQTELQSEEAESTKENVSRLKILNRETATTSEKPVTEPRKQATFAPNTNQFSSNETASRNERTSQPFQQMSQQQISKNELSSQLHVQSEVKAQQGNEDRAKRYDFASQNSDGKALNGERLEVIAGSGSSSGNQHGASFADTPNWLKFQAANQQKSGELNNPQQTFLDEHLKEVTENGDDITNDKNQMHRLGEFPVQNALIRKSVLPGLTSIMQKATASGKEVPQSWQKHSFELDDGNKIELSTRNSDGVIQLKIASSNHELTKLLQQYGQEIKEHLEKECELNIDLQFSENQDDGLSEFFSDSSSSGKGKSAGMMGSTSTAGESSKAQKPLQESVRRFGYNQMEWTA